MTAEKASFSAPHALSQAYAIKTALDEAGWTGADIGYIETHGTATPIGDPIEFNGIKLASLTKVRISKKPLS